MKTKNRVRRILILFLWIYANKVSGANCNFSGTGFNYTIVSDSIVSITSINTNGYAHSWLTNSGNLINDSTIVYSSNTISTSLCLKVKDTINACDTTICKTITFCNNVFRNDRFSISIQTRNDSSFAVLHYSGAGNSFITRVDGASIVMFNPFIYLPVGNHQICLTASSNGCVKTYCQDVSITPVVNCNLHAGFTYTIDTLANIVRFNTTSTSNATITNWKYDFGNGNTSDNIQNPACHYTQNGSYTVCLSVTDANNCTDTFCDIVNFNTHCNSAFFDLFKSGAFKIVKYTLPNGDEYYEIIGGYIYSHTTSYQLYTCTGSLICQATNINTFDSCRNLYTNSFIDSTVIWNLADTINADCETSWLNHYTDYDSLTLLHITNAMYSDQMIQVLKDSVLIARNAWARRGFIFYVYDSNSGQNWQTYQIGSSCYGPYNDVICNGFH